MKHRDSETQDQLIAELYALRRKLTALEEHLGKPARASSYESSKSSISAIINQQHDILEAIPEAVIAVADNGTIVFANEKAQALFGYDRDQLLGETIELLIPQRFQETHVQHRVGYMVKPRTRPMAERQNLVGQRRDGTEIPLKIGLSFTRIKPDGMQAAPSEIGGPLTIAMIAEAREAGAHEIAHDPSFGTLISTKLQPPRLTSDYIPRPRLFRRFDRQSALTLVSAPAGYGKSTLLSSWLETLDCPTAWLSLDENDNDLAVFLTYSIAAIQSAFPAIGQNTLGLLNVAEIPSLRIIAANLVNELNHIDQAYVIVVDDYHLIQDRRIHDLLAMILHNAPQTLHLVLASRVDPPIPLANLRARGRIVEIRAHDLRFNQRETAEFVEKLMDTPVDQATAAALEERSEGWVTGLRLAVLSRQPFLDDKLVSSGFTVDNRLVTDYLLASVFSQQPPDVQQWLVQSAILDRFCAQLCDAICLPDSKKPGTGLNGQSFVELTQQANLFVIPLDQEYRWFRFHHLFQHFLRAELGRQRTVAETGALHARASEWLEANGLLEEAFQHTLHTDDSLAPARLIERNRLDLLNDDKWPTIGRWLARLPDDMVQRRPRLLLARAWVHYFQFSLGAIPPLLQAIESMIPGEVDEVSLRAEVDFFWGNHWYWLGQSQQSLEQLGVALEHLPTTYHQGQAEAELYYALARFAMGQKKAIVQELRSTLQLEQLPYSIRSRLLGTLTFIHILSAESSKAFQAARQLEDAVAPTGNAYLKTWVSYVQAVAHFRCNNQEAAAEHFARAAENRYVLHTRAAVDSLAGLALTYQGMGQADKANSVMRQLLEFALEQKYPSYASIARSIQARLWLMQGDLESAARWPETAELAFDVGRMFLWVEVPRLTRCRVYVARGDVTGLQDAIALLMDYLQENQGQHNIVRTIEITVLLAVAFKKLGQTDQANHYLEQAVVQARSGGLIQPFLEGGSDLLDLLNHLSQQGIAPEFIGQIVTAFPVTPEPGPVVSEGALPSSVTQTELLEELTYRERAVLALLAQELSNQEIASSLTISPHTVKRHTANIYRKLGVRNRRQAVLKAKSHGLLPPG